MFHIPFWIYMGITAFLAGITIYLRKFTFVDLQMIIMIIAVSMCCDMLFCKQYKLYHYVDMTMKYVGWYSFWANVIAVPAFGYIFIKFLPSSKNRVWFYMLAWTAVFTLLEIFLLKPSGILHTLSWHTIPWSPIGYFLALAFEYIYFLQLKKQTVC